MRLARFLLLGFWLLALILSAGSALSGDDAQPPRLANATGAEPSAPCHSAASPSSAKPVAPHASHAQMHSDAPQQAPDCCAPGCGFACSSSALSAVAPDAPTAARAGAASLFGPPVPGYRAPVLPRLIRPPIG